MPRIELQKILIIQTAFIGDVILATALIEKVHQYYPDAQIDFLLRKGNENLLADHPLLNKVIIFDKKQGKYRNLLKIIRQIRKSRYDVVVNVQRYATTGIITAFSKARITIGFDKNPLSFLFSRKVKHQFDIKNSVHEVGRNQQLIASFTDEDAARPRLYPAKKDYEQVKNYKQEKYICIAPTSVWFTKQLPAEKWIEFIHFLPTGLKVYLLGAPGDFEKCREISDQLPEHQVQVLAGKINLIESAALIDDALICYVNDSAPMHIASAMNTPVVAVYCSTIPEFGYGPLSDHSSVIEVNGLDCRPCGIHGHKACPRRHFRCALDISIEEMNAKFLEIRQKA